MPSTRGKVTTQKEDVQKDLMLHLGLDLVGKRRSETNERKKKEMRGNNKSRVDNQISKRRGHVSKFHKGILQNFKRKKKKLEDKLENVNFKD